jgi:transposase
MIDRLELVQAQVAELDQERDAVLEDTAPDKAAKMIQQLATLRGVGVQSATVLVREAFVRKFPNGKALESCAGLTAIPYSSGGAEREQGISKAGNRRLRTVMVELAWLWRRYRRAMQLLSVTIFQCVGRSHAVRHNIGHSNSRDRG